RIEPAGIDAEVQPDVQRAPGLAPDRLDPRVLDVEPGQRTGQDRLAGRRRGLGPGHAAPHRQRRQGGQGLHRDSYRLRSCGSRRTRSQSPSMLADSTSMVMPMPGKTGSHHRPSISDSRSWAIMRPHDGSGGGTPTPRKLSDASMMTAMPTCKLNSTMTVFMTLGMRCRKMMVSLPIPLISASLTKSRSRSDSTSPRTTREYRLQNTSARISTTFHTPGPRTLDSRIAKTSEGSVSQASVMRMMMWSHHRPMY